MRTIESLKENEAIIINSNEEYDAIAELLDKAGKRWRDGERYSDWKVYSDAPSFSKYPIMLIVDKSIWDSLIYFCPAYSQASEFLEKKLPKYWVVDTSKDREMGRKTVLKYLNTVYGRRWSKGNLNYYGYDGNKGGNGTDGWDLVSSFQNNPTLLTIEEFLTYPEVRKVLELDEVTKTTKQKRYKLLTQTGYITSQFQKGNIYSEDYVTPGTSVDVAYLVRSFPEDWELVEDVKDTRFPFTLTMTNAKRIIGKSCPEWQEKLGKLWGKDLLVYGYVEISEDLYREIRNATNNLLIHELLDEIFGKDEVKITYEDVMKSLSNYFCITSFGGIEEADVDYWDYANTTYSKRIHEIQQAQLKLANVAKYLNNEKITNGWFFYIMNNKLIITSPIYGFDYPFVYFKTKKLAQQALEILGEETIKLACQPLND